MELNELKIGQPIIANSTCYFQGELIDVCLTSIADAYKQDRLGIRIKMAKDHNWGACPTRGLDNVIISQEDIKKLFDKRLEQYLSKNKLDHSKTVWWVGITPAKNIKVIPMTFQKKVESLAEGNYDLYASRMHQTRVVNGKTPANVWSDIDGAYIEFERLAKAYIGS